MVATTPSSPFDFRPDDALAARIIADLAEPEATLASVAELHNISRATLTLWLNTSDARARMLEIERGSAAHIRMTASLHLAAAIDTLVHILDDYRRARNASSASSSATPSPTVHPAGALQPLPLAAALKADANSARRAETARKAAYTLHRLCRYTPLTEEEIEADVRRHLQAQIRKVELHKAQLDKGQLHKTPLNNSHPPAPRPQPPASPNARPQPSRPQQPQPQTQLQTQLQTQPTHFKPTPSKPARASPASLLGAAGIAHRSPHALDPPLNALTGAPPHALANALTSAPLIHAADSPA